jgi:hypothetical protein
VIAMTLRELRKHLRNNTLSAAAATRADTAHVNSQIAVRISTLAANRNAGGERLQLPSKIVPLLP